MGSYSLAYSLAHFSHPYRGRRYRPKISGNFDVCSHRAFQSWHCHLLRVLHCFDLGHDHDCGPAVPRHPYGSQDLDYRCPQSAILSRRCRIYDVFCFRKFIGLTEVQRHQWKCYATALHVRLFAKDLINTWHFRPVFPENLYKLTPSAGK